MRSFSFSKLLKIFPKVVLTRIDKESLTGQVIFNNNITFFCKFIMMKILRKGSKLYSVSKNKCPKCHEASF